MRKPTSRLLCLGLPALLSFAGCERSSEANPTASGNEGAPTARADEGRIVVASFGPDGEPLGDDLVAAVETEPPVPFAAATTGEASQALTAKAADKAPEEKLGAELKAVMGQRLQQGLSRADAMKQKVDVTIVVADAQPEAPLPALNPLFPRESTENVARLKARLEAFDQLAQRRFGLQAPAAEAVRSAGGKLAEQFVSCNCFRAEVPLAALDALTARADVLHVELSDSPTPPPVDTNANNDIADAKTRLNYPMLSPYRATAGQSVALLDTGVRWTHTSLASGVSWLARLDCVNGGASCNNTAAAGYNPDDNDWNHGTSTASILVGNANLGSDHQGVLGSQLGSFKVYTANGLHRDATLRAFDTARRSGYDVIVAEMQDSDGSLDSAIATAAASAFDSGVTVIAANGNALQRCQVDTNGNTVPGQVGGPAHAKKVLGIGTYDINQTTNAPLNHCVGPTSDGRVKPDILMPTNTEAASNSSSTATRSFGGTSGATPYGGAAAMLIRNFYFSNGWDASPGNIYAALIANGSGSMLGPVSDRAGGGPVRLRPRSCSRWYNGWRTVSNGQSVEIPFDIGAGAQEISMAIWWDEGNTYHNNLDLTLTNPGGNIRWHSQKVGNVWERIILSNANESGRWKATIRGTSVPRGPQKVWLLLHTRLPGC